MSTPAKQEQRSIGNFLKTPSIESFLSDNLKERRGEFVSNLIALVENDNQLAACDPKKLMMCAMNATALNLPLNKNLGYAYIIPYKGIPQFQIGYKGLIQLAIRTGLYETLNAVEIREGEIERNKITGEIKFLGEKPENEIIGYIAFLKLKTGFKASLYMTEEKIENHAAKYSQVYKSDKKNNTRKSKWSDPDTRPKMALKTVIKGLLTTYGVMTTELQKAFESDSENESDVSTNARDITNIQDEPKVQKENNEPEQVQI
jgi:recombination protein RecT